MRIVVIFLIVRLFDDFLCFLFFFFGFYAYKKHLSESRYLTFLCFFVLFMLFVFFVLVKLPLITSFTMLWSHYNFQTTILMVAFSDRFGPIFSKNLLNSFAISFLSRMPFLLKKKNSLRGCCLSFLFSQ